jgi:hypothetical protein
LTEAVRRSRVVAGALCVVAMCSAASGCASYKAARPVAVCGTTVDPGGPGIAILDVWAPPLSASGSTVPAGAVIDAEDYGLVRVSDSCKTGAAIALQPADDVRMEPVARAKDGQPVVFGVARTGAGPAILVTITVTRGESVRTVHMLAYYPPPGQVESSSAPAG